VSKNKPDKTHVGRSHNELPERLTVFITHRKSGGEYKAFIRLCLAQLYNAIGT
jgi:hypothetical protein